MAARILLDTNLLVYAYDRSQPEKQKTAFALMKRIRARGVGALTSQVLAEFYTVATRKLAFPLPPEQAGRQIELLARIWPVFDVTAFTVIEAIRGVHAYQLSYWGAQIWASALLNQIPTVLTEDFNSGSVIEGVRFLNPFAPGVECQPCARLPKEHGSLPSDNQLKFPSRGSTAKQKHALSSTVTRAEIESYAKEIPAL